MKKSVNGKSFDEVFEQRGEEVKLDEMKKGEVYLLDFTYLFQCIKLARFDGMQPEKERVDVLVLSRLYNDGDYAENEPGDGCGSLSTEIDKIFSATPDQIALLNSYKN